MLVSFHCDDGDRPGQVGHRVKDCSCGREAASGGAGFVVGRFSGRQQNRGDRSSLGRRARPVSLAGRVSAITAPPGAVSVSGDQPAQPLRGSSTCAATCHQHRTARGSSPAWAETAPAGSVSAANRAVPRGGLAQPISSGSSKCHEARKLIVTHHRYHCAAGRTRHRTV